MVYFSVLKMINFELKEKQVYHIRTLWPFPSTFMVKPKKAVLGVSSFVPFKMSKNKQNQTKGTNDKYEMWGCMVKGSFCLADLHRQLASHVSPRLALTNTGLHIYTLLIHHSGSSVHWCLPLTSFLPLFRSLVPSIFTPLAICVWLGMSCICQKAVVWWLNEILVWIWFLVITARIS